jgi:hypothetical protein
MHPTEDDTPGIYQSVAQKKYAHSNTLASVVGRNVISMHVPKDDTPSVIYHGVACAVLFQIVWLTGIDNKSSMYMPHNERMHQYFTEQFCFPLPLTTIFYLVT